MARNEEALYYMNKLIALGMEAKRLQDELKEKTGIELCGLGAQNLLGEPYFLQTYHCIEKLGLPVQTRTSDVGYQEKFIEINGYEIIEVDNGELLD